MEISISGPNTGGFTGNRRRSPVDTLNNDVLLNIFYLYRLDVRDKEEDDHDGTLRIRWGDQRWWYKLAHVCRWWRFLIFASPSWLDLQLVCTYNTPVAEMLAHSPPLPLIVSYASTNRAPTAEDEESILLALRHHDRVRRIGLRMPALSLRKLIMAMDGQFLILEHVYIVPRTENNASLFFPETFQAPHLRQLALWHVAPPIRSPLLATTVGLVTLVLVAIPPSTYFQLLPQISHMPQLETLMIHFHTPPPCGHVERQLLDAPITTHVTLPNLRWFAFKGVSAYSEALFVRIRAPLLNRLHINFFNQLTITIPRLVDFLRTSENIEFSYVLLNFKRDCVLLNTFSRRQERFGQFHMQVNCRHLDWQVASTVQFFWALRPLLSAMKQLTLDYEKHDLSSERHNEVDNTQWRELLWPFNKMLITDVRNELLAKLSQSLQTTFGELRLERFPWPTKPRHGHRWGVKTIDTFTPLFFTGPSVRPLADGRLPCPFKICETTIKLGRRQDLERHILSHHLPYSLFCPTRSCRWRGARKDEFGMHSKKCHPDDNVERGLIYDTKLVLQFLHGGHPAETVERYALDLVSERAWTLGMVEEWGDLCGRRVKTGRCRCDEQRG